jgi:hypothetical protein
MHWYVADDAVDDTVDDDDDDDAGYGCGMIASWPIKDSQFCVQTKKKKTFKVTLCNSRVATRRVYSSICQ